MLASISFFSPRPAAYVVLGLGILAVTALPRLLHDKPMQFPVVLLALGAAAFALPLGFADPDLIEHAKVVEHLTEVVVIVALTNAGLKLDRHFHWREWTTTWRLLAVTMPLSVGGVALLGWWLLDLPAASALLLGAAIAPTDPVLAGEVQVGGPGQGSEVDEVKEPEDDQPEEDEARFALTSEAGLNDALAFPYVNLAILMAASAQAHAAAAATPGQPGDWTSDLPTWLLTDVLYKIGVGVVVGVVIGRLLARAVLALPSATDTGKAMTGAAALAVTAAAYGLTEWVGAYGFLATFIAAYAMRHADRDHEYHEKLVIFVEQVERILIVPVIVVLGGVVVRSFPGGVTWRLAAFAALTLLVARPLSGLVGLVKSRCTTLEALVVSFYGIRGVGSLYYVAHATTSGTFADLPTVWDGVLLVTLLSMVVHGVSGTPVLRLVDSRRTHAEQAGQAGQPE